VPLHTEKTDGDQRRKQDENTGHVREELTDRVNVKQQNRERALEHHRGSGRRSWFPAQERREESVASHLGVDTGPDEEHGTGARHHDRSDADRHGAGSRISQEVLGHQVSERHPRLLVLEDDSRALWGQIRDEDPIHEQVGDPDQRTADQHRSRHIPPRCSKLLGCVRRRVPTGERVRHEEQAGGERKRMARGLSRWVPRRPLVFTQGQAERHEREDEKTLDDDEPVLRPFRGPKPDGMEHGQGGDQSSRSKARVTRAEHREGESRRPKCADRHGSREPDE